jgi:hypothetical protein
MIFSHCIDFVEQPSLNHPCRTDKVIRVVPSTLPHFELRTAYQPHSAREVCYYSHEPFLETKGYQVEWAMEIKDVVTLAWFPKSQEIRYGKGKDFSPERLRFWVYHTFLPLLFEMERLYHVLHVGAVEVKGKAALFMAPSFGGKSTLTDHFLKAGYRLLADDTVAIEEHCGKYRAIASWPFHRPFREPETLGYETSHFVTEPLPIGGIFLLEKSDPHAMVKVEAVKGIEKFKALHQGSFIPIDFLKERTFAFKTGLARHVDLYRITVPWEKNRLGEVEKKIVSTVCTEG